MKSSKQLRYQPVNASPVKSFFVHMLTRDIDLDEAILDLLDNCVDGILRSRKNKAGNKPYSDLYAEIRFDKDSFSISDNCGGIPWELHDYAFRMGRPTNHPGDAPGIVGVYGIGMKRAIFKMGRECLISTQHGNNRYEVEISSKWMKDEGDWEIPVKAAVKPMKEDGTTIVIRDLRDGVSSKFGDDVKSFSNELNKTIASHYAFIIEKGFEVKLNGSTVEPRPMKFVFSRQDDRLPGIRPFVFRTTSSGVNVFLAVGLARPIPTQSELAMEREQLRYSAIDAGWTILCNDRAVVYCDRTELTGWGEASVPRFHNQFIAISGIVEFRADNPADLPTTTTKRGIDASSLLYLQVKNKMREGMRIFTNYTNRWKGREDEARKQINQAETISLQELKSSPKLLRMEPTKRSVPPGDQYTPSLPYPKRPSRSHVRVSFVKKIDEVDAVSNYLFKGESKAASEVGEACFDRTLREARR